MPSKPKAPDSFDKAPALTPGSYTWSEKRFPSAAYPAHLKDSLFQTRRLAALDLVKTVNEQSKSRLYQQAESGMKFTALGGVSLQPHLLDGEPTQRRIFYLRGKGCTWARANGGGCLMCGHVGGMDTQNCVSTSDYIEEFSKTFSSYDYSDTKVVAVYNGGSLLSSSEIPPVVRREILRTVASNEGVEVIIFESLPELITRKSLTSVREAIGNKRLQIGVGFESVNDDIRLFCVNKRNTLEDYINAFSVMGEFEVEALAYCLMKPVFLDEQTAIDDCVQTVKFAFGQGVKAVSIEPVSVQDNTTVALLNEAGFYRSPWTWSLFEVIRQTHFLGDVRAGGFELYPPPREYVHNCPECDEKCYQALREYNRTGKIHYFDEIDCHCKSQWRSELADHYKDDLVDRVLTQLNSLTKTQDLCDDTGYQVSTYQFDANDLARLIAAIKRWDQFLDRVFSVPMVESVTSDMLEQIALEDTEHYLNVKIHLTQCLRTLQDRALKQGIVDMCERIRKVTLHHISTTLGQLVDNIQSLKTPAKRAAKTSHDEVDSEQDAAHPPKTGMDQERWDLLLLKRKQLEAEVALDRNKVKSGITQLIEELS